MAVLLLVVGLRAVSSFQRGSPEVSLEEVDYAPLLAQAREQAAFDVLAPAPVPDGWRATSVDWDGVGPEMAWHLGFHTSDDEEYVGVEQGNAPADEFVSSHTRADRPAAPVRISGETWQRLVSQDGDETALVRRGGDSTTVVTGTPPLEVLQQFAAALR
jgi:hypothetical protein